MKKPQKPQSDGELTTVIFVLVVFTIAIWIMCHIEPNKPGWMKADEAVTSGTTVRPKWIPIPENLSQLLMMTDGKAPSQGGKIVRIILQEQPKKKVEEGK